LISHHTPSDLDARWNLLKLSERPFRKKRSTLPPRSNPRTDSVKRMGQENSGADQTHYCRHCLNHCQRPLRPCATENGGDLAQSKRFPVASTQSRSTEDSAQQVFQNRAVGGFGRPVLPGESTTGSGNHRFTIAEVSPFPPCSGCDIFRR
jgi:hypothetical protein